MPSEEAKLLNKRIGAKRTFTGQYLVNCTLIDTLPDLTMVFNGKKFTLTAYGKFYFFSLHPFLSHCNYTHNYYHMDIILLHS